MEGSDILHSAHGEPGLALRIKLHDPVVSVFIAVLASWSYEEEKKIELAQKGL